MTHATRSLLVAPGYTDAEIGRMAELVQRAGFRDPAAF
jgi:hypothetical protein